MALIMMKKHCVLMLMLIVSSDCAAKERAAAASSMASSGTTGGVASHAHSRMALKCYDGRDERSVTPKFGLQEFLGLFNKVKFYLARNDCNEMYNFHYLFGKDKYLNWDKDQNLIEGAAKEAAKRKVLLSRNSHDMYKGWYPSAQCKEGDYLVRQHDGTCNNEKLNAMGSIGTRFGRNIIPDHPKKEQDLLIPNPRTVSRKLLAKKASEKTKEHKHLNLLVTAWVQAAAHDITRHALSETEMFKIPMEKDDSQSKCGQRYMYVAKTENDSSRLQQESSLPKTYINKATHWIDSEEFYGNSKAVGDSLRTFNNGMMKIEESGILPLGKDGVPETGVNDNWWVGLELIHTLMVREHNHVASMLSEKHPSWTDQKIYDTARLIVSALAMKIHFTEWVVAVASHPVFKMSISAFFGSFPKYLQNKAHMALNHLARTLPDDVNKVVQGTFGVRRTFNKHPNGSDVPLSTTEEYSSFYRLHSLLPDSMDFYKFDNCSMPVKQGTVKLSDTLGTKSRNFFVNNSLADLVLSFAMNHPAQMTLNNYPAFLQNLETTKGNFIDLGAIDILRDRERGLPLYNEFREKFQLKKFDSLHDLTNDIDTIAALEEVYGKENTIDKVDLLIGMLAEKRPNCCGVGEIATSLIFLEGNIFIGKDSFFTNRFTEEFYTEEGIEWVKNSSLKNLLLRHIPELHSTGLTDVENAFFYWV